MTRTENLLYFIWEQKEAFFLTEKNRKSVIEREVNMGMVRIKEEVIKSWLSNKTTPPKTQDEVAQHLGVSQSLLHLILTGARQVTVKLQGKFCDLTGYDIGDLFFYDRNKEAEEDTEK